MPWFLGVVLSVFVPLVLVNIYVGRKLTTALVHLRSWERTHVLRWVHGVQALLNLYPVAAVVTFWISGRTGMSVFNGEDGVIDALLVYPFWIALVVSVQLALVFIVWDTVRIVGTRVFFGDKDRWAFGNRKVILVMTLLVVVYSVPAIIVQTFYPRVVERDIILPDRLRDLNGVRILQISDVQGDGRNSRDRVDDIVRMANELEPDLIVNCGDLVTSGETYIKETADALSFLRSRYGSYAVVGDHDIFSGIKKQVVSALRSTGTTMLEDTSIFIPLDNGVIGLSFVTYTYPQRPDSAKLERDVFVLPDSVFRVLLVHQPAMPLVRRASEEGYDLFLAGHTHGGGVSFGLPGIGYLAPASFETDYVSGFYRVNDMIVSVTNGLGFTLAPIRFQAPIEMTLLTLRARSTTGETIL